MISGLKSSTDQETSPVVLRKQDSSDGRSKGETSHSVFAARIISVFCIEDLSRKITVTGLDLRLLHTLS